MYLERIIDPIIHIPATIETYNDISYAVFRMTQSLSAISVEAVLFYPFEVLQASYDGNFFILISIVILLRMSQKHQSDTKTVLQNIQFSLILLPKLTD
jgi:hypothetical protein